jgi:hypothetical protein
MKDMSVPPRQPRPPAVKAAIRGFRACSRVVDRGVKATKLELRLARLYAKLGL